MAQDLFSRIYVNETIDKEDDPRMRKRLAAQAKHLTVQRIEVAHQFAVLVEAELGVEMPGVGSYVDIDKFFERAALRDVLDGITLFGSALLNRAGPRGVNEWFAFCERVMRERGMRYRVDEKRVVHFYIDEPFQAAAAAAVAALSAPKYAGAAASIQSSIDELNGLNGSPKVAIRDVFEGLETAFKVALNTNANLGERKSRALCNPRLTSNLQMPMPWKKVRQQVLYSR